MKTSGKTPPWIYLRSKGSARNESTNGVGQVTEADGAVDVVGVVGAQKILLGYEVGDEDLHEQELNQRLLFLLGKFTLAQALGLNYPPLQKSVLVIPIYYYTQYGL